MQLTMNLPDNMDSLHATEIGGMWTMSVGGHDPDGNAYVERVEADSLDEAQTELELLLANHQ
jgi:hypothetical protein